MSKGMLSSCAQRIVSEVHKACQKQRAHEVPDKYGFGLCELANNERTWTCESEKYSLVREIRSKFQTFLESGVLAHSCVRLLISTLKKLCFRFLLQMSAYYVKRWGRRKQ